MKLKWIFTMALAIILGVTQAQIVNGDFSANTGGCGGGLGCCGINPSGWTGTNDLQVTNCCNTGNTNGWWVDMTSCGSGNGRWIEQTVPTIPGRTYLLEWDQGCWNGGSFFDAGLDLTIDGNNLGRFAFANFTGNSLAWQRFTHCFIATQSATTIRFTCNSLATASSPPGSTLPVVTGLDNVDLTDLSGQFLLNAQAGEKCNEFCFSLVSQAPPGTTVSNENWYVDNVLELSNSSTFCRVFPKNVTKQVRVDFSVTTACGTTTYSLQQPVTATDDCPCDLQSNIALSHTFTSCNSVVFSMTLPPDYSVLCHQWTLDGKKMNGPANGITLSNLAPGQHTVCMNALGGMDGEEEDVCCAKVCEVIHVQDQNVSECEVFAEACYQLTDEGSPWYFTNFMNNCPECQNTVLNATYAGPWQVLSHTSSGLGGGPRMIVTREYVDEASCSKCIVTFTVANTYATDITVIGEPCTTVPLPPCLQGQQLKMFINGHPENTSDVPGGMDIVLCCDNPYGILNPTYIIYSETDPCCNMIVNLNCDQAGAAMKPTAIKGQNSEQGESVLKIIPNPTASIFHIASTKEYETYKKVEIVDLKGTVLLVREHINSNTEIDASALNKGTYLVRITTGTGEQVRLKLIVVSD